MKYRFALVGNPNSGKTTLFNQLTGNRAHVGNWPGVTVERKEGFYVAGSDTIEIVDLPGVYSLTPYSEEEVVARNYIIDEHPDLIINIVDATNLERNLYLSSQLIETGVPVVIALNMMDAVEAKGDTIEADKLAEGFAVPFIPISAARGEGVKTLMAQCLLHLKNKKPGIETILKDTEAYPYIKKVQEYLSDNHCPHTFFHAVKLLEGDEVLLRQLELQHLVKINSISASIGDWDIVVADLRYRFITELTSTYVKKRSLPQVLTLSDKIDGILTHRIWGIPLFLMVMFLVFQLAVGLIGPVLTGWLELLMDEYISVWAESRLISFGAPLWLISLVSEGVIGGVGSIIAFLPQIMLLFLALSFLEDSGYMARAAFLMDMPLRKVGLSGKSFVPMIMGFGCSVPAIMAARTLENEKDRRATIILTPFMSCGARMPVYLIFVGAFFSNHQGIIIFSLYLLGILIALISGVILKKTILRGEEPTFIMELPPYRMPSLNTTMLHMWEKAKDFFVRAGTIILAAMMVIWFCQHFNFKLQMVDYQAESIAGTVGSIIAPVFAPLGFGSWQASVALIAGFVAKEAVVGTLEVLYGVAEGSLESLSDVSAIQQAFTPLSAYSFMVFVLLYMPCIAAFAAIKREMNSWKWTWFAVGYQTFAAWVMAFIVYQGGRILGLQ